MKPRFICKYNSATRMWHITTTGKYVLFLMHAYSKKAKSIKREKGTIH